VRAIARTRPEAVLFTESRFRPDNLFCGLARLHIQVRQLRCKRVYQTASIGRCGHGLWHVTGAAPLHCAARLTRAPTYLYRPPPCPVLDYFAPLGTIYRCFPQWGSYVIHHPPSLCVGAPIFSTFLLPDREMSLSTQNATRFSLSRL